MLVSTFTNSAINEEFWDSPAKPTNEGINAGEIQRNPAQHGAGGGISSDVGVWDTPTY